MTGIKQRKQLPPALCSPHPLEGEHHDDKLGLDKGHLHMTKQPGTGGEPLQQGYMWHRLSGGADLLPSSLCLPLMQQHVVSRARRCTRGSGTYPEGKERKMVRSYSRISPFQSVHTLCLSTFPALRFISFC